MEKNIKAKNEKGRMAVFIENMVAYGLTTVLEKMVPLIMLPIITSLLTDTADYGRYDMFNTIVQFGTNIAVLGMYDAMFREFFEEDTKEYKTKVTSTAMGIVFWSAIFVACILAVFNTSFSKVFLGDSESGMIVMLSAIAVAFSAYKNIVSAPIRMENRRKTYIAFSLVGSVLYYTLAIIFVYRGYNYAGLMYANIIYVIISCLLYFVITKKYFVLGKWDKRIAKNLLKIGLPLLPTFLAYWIFHAMDKIMITNMINLKAVGIYSVGSKVAQVSQIVYSAFAVGWQYFAFSRMKDKDQVELNTKILEYLAVISFVVFMIATLFDDIVFNILFSGDYIKGVEVFPFLFLSPLVLMLYQVVGNQTIVYKKSYLNTLSLVLGTIVNLILNYVLISKIGIKGASIATLSSYVVSLICIMVISKKKGWLIITKRFISISCITALYIMLLIFNESGTNNIIAVIGAIIIIVLYFKDFKQAFCNMVRKRG